MTTQNTAFIASLIPGAQAAQEIFSVPVSVTIAQAILESGWGNSGLSKKAFNLFGIKADKSWHGDTVIMPTTEYIGGKRIVVDAPFRKYAGFAESIADHAKFLARNERYSAAFKCENGCEFAKSIAKAGYATEQKYSDLLIALINQYNLGQYDA